MSWRDFAPSQLQRTSALLGVVLSQGSVGCIDTRLDTTPAEVACPSPAEALSNVVFINVDLGDLGSIRCSGVALTNTVIATALGCVMVPNELADLYEIPPGADSQPLGDVYEAGAPDEGDCRGEEAVENGSFSTQFGDPLPRDAIYVYLTTEDISDGHPVAEVVRAPATRCSGGLALLKLSSRVDLEPIPIRTSRAPDPDESVILSYVSVGSNYALERHDIAMTLPEELQPRSLDAPETCPEQSGAGLFAASTGALLGLVDTSFGSPDCSALGRGVAVRLGAFRRLLEKVAAPEELLAEPGSTTPDLVACRAE